LQIFQIFDHIPSHCHVERSSRETCFPSSEKQQVPFDSTPGMLSSIFLTYWQGGKNVAGQTLSSKFATANLQFEI
jgi:hypothetical protein